MQRKHYSGFEVREITSNWEQTAMSGGVVSNCGFKWWLQFYSLEIVGKRHWKCPWANPCPILVFTTITKSWNALWNFVFIIFINSYLHVIKNFCVRSLGILTNKFNNYYDCVCDNFHYFPEVFSFYPCLITHPYPWSPEASGLCFVPMIWAFWESQLEELLLVLFDLAEYTECRSTM